MSDKLQSQVEALFHQVVQNPVDQQDAFLAEHCDDPSIRAAVQELLQFDRLYSEGPTEQPESKLPEREDELSSRIGRYKLLQRIGEGGMGDVYMAEQTEPVHRRVALKVIKLGMDTKQVVARFEAERQALAMMDHPNIAKVLDAGTTETGRPYFVMELVQGIPITAFCEENGLSARERLQLLIPVCRAIQSAHGKGVIHRDIKPSNLLVTVRHGEPMPMVIDFGIAKAVNQKLTEKTYFTKFAAMIGTPGYMSPEQAEMTSMDVDTRSDIYSLGAVLYELLTGTTPFEERRLREAGYGEMCRIIKEEHPEKPSTRVTRLSGMGSAEQDDRRHNLGVTKPHELTRDLDWITMKCLEKDRQRRYETPNELAAELVRFLNNEPVMAAAPSLSYQLAKLYRRNKTAAHLCLSVILALLIGFFGVLWQWRAAVNARKEKEHQTQVALDARDNARREEERARLAEQRAQDRAREVQRNLASEYLRRGQRLCEQDAVSQGLHWFVRALETVPSDSRDFEAAVRENVTAWAPYANTPVAILQHLELPRYVASSPDGNFFVTKTTTGKNRVWSVSSKDELAVIRDSAAEWPTYPTAQEKKVEVTNVAPFVRSIAFSRDGQRIWSWYDHILFVWAWKANKAVRVRLEQIETILAYDSPGLRVLGIADNGALGVWSIEVSEPLRPKLIRPKLITATSSKPVRAAFSENGDLVAVAGEDGNVQIWSTESWKIVSDFPTQHQRIERLSTSANGRFVATAAAGGEVKVWITATGKMLNQPIHRYGEVRELQFSANENRLLTVHGTTARVWDVETGQVLGPPISHDDQVYAMLSYDGERVVTTSGNVLRIWSASTGVPLGAPMAGIFYGVFTSDGKYVLVVPGGQVALLMQVNEPEVTTRKLNHLKHIGLCGVTMSPSGEYLLNASTFTNSLLFELGTDAAPTKLVGPGACAGAFTPDETSIITAGSDGRLSIWSVPSGDLLESHDAHSNAIRALTIAPDGRSLATGSFDGTAAIWDISTFQRIALFEHGDHFVEDIVFSPNGKLLITGCGDGMTRVWSVASGELVFPPFAHRGSVLAVGCTPDGKRAVSGGRDRTVRFWDLETGAPVGPVLRHESPIEDIAFSPDGTRLAVATNDGTAYLWSAQSGERIGPPLRHSSEKGMRTEHPLTIFELEFDPSGNRLITANYEGVVTFWTLPTPLSPDVSVIDFVEAKTSMQMDKDGNLSWLDPTEN